MSEDGEDVDEVNEKQSKNNLLSVSQSSPSVSPASSPTVSPRVLKKKRASSEKPSQNDLSTASPATRPKRGGGKYLARLKGALNSRRKASLSLSSSGEDQSNIIVPETAEVDKAFASHCAAFQLGGAEEEVHRWATSRKWHVANMKTGKMTPKEMVKKLVAQQSASHVQKAAELCASEPPTWVIALCVEGGVAPLVAALVSFEGKAIKYAEDTAAVMAVLRCFHHFVASPWCCNALAQQEPVLPLINCLSKEHSFEVRDLACEVLAALVAAKDVPSAEAALRGFASFSVMQKERLRFTTLVELAKESLNAAFLINELVRSQVEGRRAVLLKEFEALGVAAVMKPLAQDEETEEVAADFFALQRSVEAAAGEDEDEPIQKVDPLEGLDTSALFERVHDTVKDDPVLLAQLDYMLRSLTAFNSTGTQESAYQWQLAGQLLHQIAWMRSHNDFDLVDLRGSSVSLDDLVAGMEARERTERMEHRLKELECEMYGVHMVIDDLESDLSAARKTTDYWRLKAKKRKGGHKTKKKRHRREKSTASPMVVRKLEVPAQTSPEAALLSPRGEIFSKVDSDDEK